MKKMITRAAIALALSAVSNLPARSIADGHGVAVMIGGEAEYDACGSTGAVSGLNPDGDNFLAVRNGPGGSYKMVDKLRTNDQVYMCDSQGDWIGIVYGRNNMDCNVSSPVPRKRAYNGSCNSGWVHKRYITTIAG